MRVIIAGSRGISDYQQVVDAVEAAEMFEGIIPKIVLSGVAGGVDRMGERYAAEKGLECKLYPAEWRQGPTAGFARNYTMAQNSDALIAVWDGSSPGTRHMINLARKYKLAVYVAEVAL